MKRNQGLLALLCLLVLWGGASSALAVGPEPAVVEIKEKLFIAQTNDIFLNPDEYMGKRIRWQGIYSCLDYGEPYHLVYRYGPGCCGDDGMAGFEVAWDGKYPQLDSWVEAEGTLEFYEENGTEYLRIRLSALVPLEEWGATFVSQ